MRRRFLFALAAAWLAAPTLQAAGGQSPFVLGIAPHTSARVILEMYQPLRRYLEAPLPRSGAAASGRGAHGARFH